MSEAKKVIDGSSWRVEADVRQTERARNETAGMRKDSRIGHSTSIGTKRVVQTRITETKITLLLGQRAVRRFRSRGGVSWRTKSNAGTMGKNSTREADKRAANGSYISYRATCEGEGRRRRNRSDSKASGKGRGSEWAKAELES